jgi:hypothetical protein
MLSGGCQGSKTSRMRFCAASYSACDPAGRSHQVTTYFTATSVRPTLGRS